MEGNVNFSIGGKICIITLKKHSPAPSKMNLCMPQVLSSPGHTLYTLSNSHAQHASGPIKSWTHPMHTHHKSCSRLFTPVLFTPVLSTLAKSRKQPKMPIGSSVYKLWYSHVREYCTAVKKIGFQLWETYSVGHRRYHKCVSIYLKFKNGWTKQYLI